MDDAEARERYEKKQAQTWGMACHLAGLAAYTGFPFGGIVGPLVVWLIKKDEYPFVEEQGRSALNFQISWAIYEVAAGILCFFIIGIPILILLVIAHFILTIVGSVKIGNGNEWSYPLTFTFLKDQRRDQYPSA